MNKDKFLEMLTKSTLDEKIKTEYYEKFVSLLSVIDSKSYLEIGFLKDLTQNKFEFFIRSHNEKKIKDYLDEIYLKLGEWVKSNVCVETITKMANITRNLRYKNELDNKNEKKKRIIAVIFLVVLILFSLTAATFSFLDVFEVINDGNKIASACGVLDFIFGVIFFVIEKIDDMKKKKQDEDFNNNLSSGNSSINYKKIKIGKMGNGNTVINGDVKTIYANDNIDLDKLLFPKN